MASEKNRRALEDLLDSMKPEKNTWPEGNIRELYFGALAAIETLGFEWTQLESGQHVVMDPDELPRA